MINERFAERAALLTDCAQLEVSEVQGGTTYRLRPYRAGAVGVVLWLGGTDPEHGTISLDDPASAPAEIGEDAHDDLDAVDYFIDIAVEGRATAFHVGRGGCIEVRGERAESRTWMNAWPWPGRRRRTRVVKYLPYR